MTHENKAQALLDSPAGCAFLLEVAANRHLPLESFASPKVSFWLAASAIDFADVNRNAGWQEIALREARSYESLALQIASNSAFDWWYEPVDLGAQVWSSPQMSHGTDRSSPLEPFLPERWGRPRPRDFQSINPQPTSSQHTSTLRDGSTSEWTTFVLGAGDHLCSFPLAAWRVRFIQDVRVWEINHSADWHSLCAEYPRKASDGRLVPDWQKVAHDWDGVHLTLGGMLSSEQARYEQAHGWSMLQFWHSEQTHWLNRLAITGERMPDVQRFHNEQSFNTYPYDFEELFGFPESLTLPPER